MDNNEIKSIARKLLGDDYYEKLGLLQSDLEFFRMYMRREKKSEFSFDVKIIPYGGRNAFDDIWETFARNISYLEDAFAIFVVLRAFVVDVKEDGDRLSFETKKNFACYFKEMLELDITDYIGDFVGCSYAITEVKETIRKQFA